MCGGHIPAICCHLLFETIYCYYFCHYLFAVLPARAWSLQLLIRPLPRKKGRRRHPMICMLWGPRDPNLYIAFTQRYTDGDAVDTYETQFGIRSLDSNPELDLLVNGRRPQIKSVNQHYNLDALRAVLNPRAAGHQLEILQEMCCNVIRMAHNPPKLELLDLTERVHL